MSLPELTRTIDDDFVNTWYEIRPMVSDNIMAARVFFAALEHFGCIKTQVGGEFVTRSVGYGKKSTQRFTKGTTLTQSEPALDTMGIWNWRYFAVDVTRSLVDDQKNAGKFKIKDYVARRIENARECIIEDLETYLMQWGAAYDAPAQINGIKDIVAPYTAQSYLLDESAANESSSTYATGTSNGGISRVSNTWWRNWVAQDSATENTTNKLLATHAPYSINLVQDMEHIYQTVKANQEEIDFILCNQLLYEAYMDEARDKQQIVINGFTKKAIDLGFDAATYHGATISWSSAMAQKTTYNPYPEMLFLNMSHIEFVKDPNYWMSMTNWKETTNQLERVAYIIGVSTGLLTDQPRRHCSATWAS